jgi:DUF438 domain-containing protein
MSELINNREKRVEELAGIIRKLHDGQDPGSVKADLARIVGETSSEEIVDMEQQLISSGMSVDEIKSMCDLHSQVLGELVVDRLQAQTPGHPLHTFQIENEAIAKTAAGMRQLMVTLPGSDLDETLARWRKLHEQLLEVEKHYARKENILFPHMERHGITGPSQVMWGKDDDIRVMLRSLRGALVSRKKPTIEELTLVAEKIALPMLEQVEEMISKEEKILFPIAIKRLSPEQWGDIYRDTPRFGYCLVEPGTGYRPPAAAQQDADSVTTQRIPVGSGSLNLEQLRSVFATLPVDLTFVDADDRVAFFSEGGDRIFERSPAIIGRKVQNCHPPQSVDVVNRIVADFRAGREDVAEFWIELGGKFVHIRYFAMRNESGEYLGTLEVTQDLTPLRALEGERRLLQYESKGRESDQVGPAAIPLQQKAQGDDDGSWIPGKQLKKTIDADEMLKTGVHPLAEVMQLAGGLGENEVIRILSSFRPEPLIETVRNAGHRAYCAPGESGRFETTIG